MVAIEDIRDPDNFKAWLEETNQPREACVALAARTALRVLPLAWADAERAGKYSALPFLRANLVASVAGLAPSSGVATNPKATNALKAAANAAVNANNWNARRIQTPAAGSARAAASGVADYRSALVPNDAVNCAVWAADAAQAATTRPDDVWTALRSDCAHLVDDRSLRTSPLFPDVQPSWIANAIQHIHNAHPQSFSDVPNVAEIPNAAAIGSKESRDWSFWLDWYQRLLDGREQNWPLLLEIATQDDAFWQGSDEQINNRIGLLEEWSRVNVVPSFDTLAATKTKTPNAERETNPSSETFAPIDLEAFKSKFENGDRVVLNKEMRLDREPVSDLSPTELATIVQRVTGAIEFLRSASGFGNSAKSLGECLDHSEFFIRRRPDFPVDVHNALERSHRMFGRYITQGSLPDNEPRIVDFIELLADNALELEQRDSRVQERMRLLGSAQPVNLPEGDAQDYREQVEVLAGVSTLEFAEEQRHAARIATDPNAEDEDRKEAQYKSFGWLLRFWDNVWEYADKLCIKVQTLEKIGLLLKRLYDLWKKLDPDGGPTC